MKKTQLDIGFKNISKWILKRFIGLLLLTGGIFLVVSLISFAETDPYYGFESGVNINNLLGVWGGYASGTLLHYLDLPSYLLAFFSIIWGSKIIINIKISYKIIRVAVFVFVVVALSCIFAQFNFYENIIGNYIYSRYLENLFSNYDSNYLIYSFNILFAIILLPLLLFALSINNIYLLILFRYLLNFLNYLLKIIGKIFQILLTKKTRKPIIRHQEPPIDKNLQLDNKFRSESKLKSKKIFTNTNSKQTSLNFNNELNYELPNLNLLKNPLRKGSNFEESKNDLEEKADKLVNVLAEFGIQGSITNVRPGPIVTMYELEPSAGTKASRIINLTDDIARSMSALSVRISSQPGRNIIGIELPNKKRSPVYLSELLSHEDFENNENSLVLALGKDISGTPIMTDLEKMPHLLIAGTTGSGKSVGLNSMIVSLLYKLKPSECRFILIDPKMLELSIYDNIPHLMAPVVTDPHKAIVALKWAVKEMENRYRLMNHAGVKNIISYNHKISDLVKKGTTMYREITTGLDPDTNLPIVEKIEIPNESFPYIVVVIDEMADLMMVAGKDVEFAIQRLAQMARAAGIHLIMATQRPSVDVITGTIKANFPSRISYHVASKFDSRTILNEMGAEQLLGSGDMLFMESGGKIRRLHGGFISESEINNIVKYIKAQSKPDFSKDITSEQNLTYDESGFNSNNEVIDELYDKAVQLVIKEQKASTSFIQRHLRIGYNRAARIIEQMEKEGLVTEGNYVGKREVLKNNV